MSKPKPHLQQIIDFMPIIAFFVAYWMQDLIFATGVLIVCTIATIVFSKIKRWEISKKTLFGAILITIFGGLTLILQDDFYIKFKATISFSIAGLVFLIALYGWKKSLLEMFMGDMVELSKQQWFNISRDTALFFFAVAIANEFARRLLDTDSWVIFKVFGVSTLSVVFFALSFGIRVYKNEHANNAPKDSHEPPSIKD